MNSLRQALRAKLAKKFEEQLYGAHLSFRRRSHKILTTLLYQDRQRSPFKDTTAATLFKPSIAQPRKWIPIEVDITSSAPAQDPTSPCQRPSTLVAAQLSGPISASTQIREEDQVPYLGTRLQVQRVKKIPHQREAGAELAIWRATKKLR